MSIPLHLLIIEDSSDDAQLMVRTIQRGGYDVQYERVETEAALRTALQSDRWDVILCDYTLPALNAVRALELVKASGRDLPFIIVSGSIGEEMAIAALRGGAHDFMLKGNLARLVPAIRRELQEVETRRQRSRAETQADRTAGLLDTVIEAANVIFLQLDTAGNVVRLNSAAEEITGYSRAELQGRNWSELVVPQDRYPQVWREFERIIRTSEPAGTFENPILTKRGEERIILWKNSVLREDGRVTGTVSFGIDITERMRAEAALSEAEARYRLLVERMPAITYVVSGEPPYRTLYISPQVEQILGFTAREWYEDPDLWERQIHPDDRERVLAEDRASRQAERSFVAEYRILRPDGRAVWLHDETHHVKEPGMASFSQGIEIDITKRKEAEAALRDAETQYRVLVEQLPMIIYMKSAEDVGAATYVSPQVESILGYRPQEWLQDPTFWQTAIHPDDRQRVLERIERTNRTGEPFDMHYRMIARDGRVLWFRDQAAPVRDVSGQIGRWQGLLVDVTEARQREREWEAIARLSQALRQTQTVQEIVPRLLDETLALMDSDQGSIWLRDSVGGQSYLAGQRNWDEAAISAYAHATPLVDFVISRSQTIVQREIRSDLRISEEVRRQIPPGIGGACVPLAAAGRAIGALFVNVRLPREIMPDELRVLGALAELGAYAIHRAQLFEETAQHLDHLAALRSIDMAISSSFDLRMILNVVLDNVLRELKVDAATILLLKPETLVLEFAAGKGFRTHAIESASLAAGEGLPGKAVLERDITYIDDLQTFREPLRRPYLVTEEEFISYYGVPLVAKGRVKGVLEIFHRSPLKRDAAWMQFLESLAGQAAIAIDSSSIFQDLQRSNMELALAYDATIEGWSHMLDLRDRETEGHTLRVTEMALKLARAMGMDDEALVQLRRGGLLHDIGKMGVPDSVLLKPGRLNEEEWSVMRRHPQFAYEMLSSVPYLRPALDVPYCHHEQWDGGGYPRGLKGEQIPFAARIFSVVDVWDALSNDRPYRPARRPDAVLEYIRAESGRHFDPAVVEAFIQLMAAESLTSPLN